MVSARGISSKPKFVRRAALAVRPVTRHVVLGRRTRCARYRQRGKRATFAGGAEAHSCGDCGDELDQQHY